MSLRLELATALEAAVPTGWKVIPYGQYPANPSKPFLLIQQKAVRPTQQAPHLYRDTDFTVNLVIPELDPKKVEDLLDEHAKTVMDLLDTINFPGLVWAEGERATFDEKFHGYSFTATITHDKDA